MHSFHILNVPLYVIVIVVLVKIRSKAFQTYKFYLIWHTFLNEAIEVHNVYLMLPVVHLPYPVLRATGALANVGFSGLFLFYILSLLIIQTGCSVLEMFWFRYRASLYDYKSRKFSKFIETLIFSCRFCVFLFPLLSFGTFFYSIERQAVYKKALILSDPHVFPEIGCYSVVLAAPFSDSVMVCTMLVWFALIIITFSVIPSTTVYLNSHLGHSQNMSSGVLRMQKMLLMSLIVQTFVHGIMLGIPNLLFVYAIFFGSDHEILAYVAFVSLTFHGFFSTLAMIVFTKPIQNGIGDLFPMKRCFRTTSEGGARNPINC